MILSPLTLAQQCASVYDPATPGVRSVCNIAFSINTVSTVLGDVDVIALRGSQTIGDWIRDFIFAPVWDDQLGYCHAGFLLGIEPLFQLVRQQVGPRVVITGHSLGGAEARLLAGKFIVNNLPLLQVTVFGSPKPAFINLARIFDKWGGSHTSYRNHNDPVPKVPFEIEPFLDFVHTEPWTQIDCPATPGNLDPLRDHSIGLYGEALKKPA